MVVFPNAKINLGLRITSKRPDGYHNLDTVFYPIELTDVLEVIKVQKSSDASIVITGKEIQGPADKNLCIKAYQLIKADHPEISGIQIHLHKSIPMGAGMGGGSADGAFMVRLLNSLFNLGLGDEEMSAYALKLGSDCPIFIKNKACYATGRGELLEEIDIDLSRYYLLIVSPGIHVSTADAFEKIIPNTSIKPCKEIVQLPIEKWKDHLINDFEMTVFESHPVLKNIKEKLYHIGALYSSMTGTGSTLFGIFKERPAYEHVFDKKFEINLICPKNQY